jgi:hypothetical protein
MIRRLAKLIFCGGACSASFGQELKCNVTVNSNQIPQVEQDIFAAMQKGVYEFVNNTAWTEDVFAQHEKIEAAILINLTEQVKDGQGQVIADQYKGTILVQSRRRIYNSTYDCQMLNYQDNNFTFSYVPFQQFYYSESSSMSNLTAVIAFYCYMIIGLDYDSYSMNGGDKYLQKALNIVNMSQNLAEPGWKASETANRYYMINDYLNPAFKPLRELEYNYHRLGYDVMASDLPGGRKIVFAALKTLEKIWSQRPNAFLLQIFFSTKRNEIMDMLKETKAADKAEIIPILKKVDPSQSSKYDALVGDPQMN